MKHNLHKMMAMFVASIFAVGAFAQTDVTNKVGTSKEAWHTGGGPVTIDGISMPEHYLTNTVTLGEVMWQEVTGLDNGKYTVELWANARYTSGRGFSSDAADGAEGFTYLYANNVEISIPVYHNGELNNNKSYTLENVMVTDGTLKMGMTKKAAGSNWHTIQIKSLIYNGVDLTALKDAFTAKWNEYVAYSEETLNNSWNAVNNNYFWPVYDEAEAFAAGLEDVTEAAAIEAMMAKMSAAIASVEAAYAAGVEHAKYSALMENAVGFSEMADEAECMAAYEVYQANSGMMFGYSADTKEAIEAATALIKDAYLQFIANAIPAEGIMFDMNFAIVNPNFDKNVEGWTCVKAQHNGGAGYDNVGGIAEIADWNASSWEASMTQTLNGLPNGKYIVKAAWMAASGIQMTFAANAGKTTVTGIGDTGGNIANDGSVVEMGQGYRGWQYVEVEGLVEDGTLTIAVSSSASVEHVWSNADAFELYYGGYLEDPEAAALAQKKEIFLARAEQFRAFMDNNVDWSLQMINQTYLYPVSDEVLGDETYGIVGLVDRMDEVTEVETLEHWMAEMDKVEALLAEANAAAAEFAKWQGLIQHAAGFAATYDEATVEAAMMYMEFSVGYNCATVEAINEAAVGAEEAYKNFVLGATPVEGEVFDVTFLIADAAVTSTEAWETNAGINSNVAYEGAPDVYALDVWNGGQLEVYAKQTLTNLPEGAYNLTAMGRRNNDAVVMSLYASANGQEYKSDIPAGENWHELQIEGINVVDGTMVVGFEGTTNNSWVSFDNFKLYYAGKDGGLVDGIKSVKSETNAVIYDLQGRRVQKMEKGLYIVNGKKVLVK